MEFNLCTRCNLKEKEKYQQICSSCRMKEWRKKNPDKIKAYLKRNEKRIMKHRKEYYKLHKEKQNAYCSERRKLTNYAEDKTPERRRDALIRSKTRQKYPLKGKKCIFCKYKAEHRHHTTEPMEVDKFIFLCKKHHQEIHGKINHDASQEDSE